MGVWDSPSRLTRRPDGWDAGGASRRDRTVQVVGADRIRFGSGASSQASYLGHVGADAWFAESISEAPDAVPSREARLSETEQELVARGIALTQWHRGARHCEQCGAETVPEHRGASRRCPACGAQSFPRTDPAVIVAVLDPDDRLLLAHQPSWPRGRVSVLAGFVEAGESAEQACHREIYEEAGVRLRGLRFFATQPWPYPRSLMLAFFASAADDQVCADGVELSWARFFSREEANQAIAGGQILLPNPVSVAHRMISGWLSGVITVDSVRSGQQPQ